MKKEYEIQLNSERKKLNKWLQICNKHEHVH